MLLIFILYFEKYKDLSLEVKTKTRKLSDRRDLVL